MKEETEETGDALPRVPPASSGLKPGRKEEMETREREEWEGSDWGGGSGGGGIPMEETEMKRARRRK